MKRKHLILWVVLAGAMLLLSGCGVPREGVDVTSVPPENFWQTLIVWPLAKALIWLNTLLSQIDVPYSWGFAIILFTIGIKVITFPLTMTQVRGMQAQKKLQPKLQELQKKYGKDREKLAQEQMKLYQEAGVNPLSGCLPLLVQMPVLFGLYSALIALGPALEDAHFFWIPNLGFPRYTDGLTWIMEFFRNGEFGLLAAYLVLPVLLMASQVLMQKYMTMTPTTSSEGQAGMMNQMTTIMTLMFGFFTLQVPAGLTLYWVTSNLLQMGQQALVMRVQDDEEESGGVSKTSAEVSPNGKTDAVDAKAVTKKKPAKRSRRQRKRK